MNNKTCNKCKQVKQITDFHKDKTKKDGHRGNCKDCLNAYKREKYGYNKKEPLTIKCCENNNGYGYYLVDIYIDDKRIQKKARFGKRYTKEEAHIKILDMKQELLKQI
jgi:hypothetical protein